MLGGLLRNPALVLLVLAPLLILGYIAFRRVGSGFMPAISEMQQPLAIAIISGLIVQLPLVLGVMPVLFSLTQRRRKGAAPTPAPSANEEQASLVEDAAPAASTIS